MENRCRRLVIYVETERALGADEEPYSRAELYAVQ
jgi:hypothetical protein